MATIFTKPAFQAPGELTALDQWVLWRQEYRRGKATKVPYQCDGGPAKTDDSATWVSYPAVHAAFRPESFSGIGFVFSERDRYAGIDLDDCLDHNGITKPWASPILEQFTASYCEISPSHGGVKCFVAADLPGQGKSLRYMDGRIEMYDRGRFFTVTGQAFRGAPLAIADRQASVTALYDRLKRLQSFRKGTTEKVPSGQRHQLPARKLRKSREVTHRCFPKLTQAVFG